MPNRMSTLTNCATVSESTPPTAHSATIRTRVPFETTLGQRETATLQRGALPDTVFQRLCLSGLGIAIAMPIQSNNARLSAMNL